MLSGRRLRQARERAGISRERAAAQLEPPISAKTLERWEKGVNEGPIPSWRDRGTQLARLYGCRLRDLTEPKAVAA